MCCCDGLIDVVERFCEYVQDYFIRIQSCSFSRLQGNDLGRIISFWKMSLAFVDPRTLFRLNVRLDALCEVL